MCFTIIVKTAPPAAADRADTQSVSAAGIDAHFAAQAIAARATSRRTR